MISTWLKREFKELSTNGVGEYGVRRILTDIRLRISLIANVWFKPSFIAWPGLYDTQQING